MSNKLLIGVIVIVVLLVGVVVMSSQQSSQVAPPAAQESTTELSEASEVTPEATAEGEEAAMEKEVTVNVTDAGFDQKSVTVKAGTKVVWVNKTEQTANVSSAKHPTHLIYPPLNLGNFEPEESVSLVFDKQGSYNYHNHLQPTKFGTVVVE